VLGVATARRAAAELRDGAGIQSTSTFALLADLRGAAPRLPSRCVLVVDEAGMVPTREIVELSEHVGAAEGKLVLVGDHRQLPELQAGGVFRALVARGLAIELTENVRQVHAWERHALDQLRDGQPEPALAAYAEHDRLTVAATGDAARERLVADWVAAGDPDGAVMIAQRRADVADLNSRARERLRAAGVLGPELETAAGTFAAGDVVVVKRNDTRRGVSNGDRARVTAIEPDSGSVVIERRGQRVRLDRRFLTEPTTAGDPPLVHGYAITGHIAQGLTVDQAFVLAGEGIDREWAYVALSRGRESNRLYVAATFDDDRAEYAPAKPPTTDPIKRLARQLASSSAQVLAIDSGRPAEPDPVGASAEALERATGDRRGLETRSLGWLPGRRRELEAAREREADARRARLEAAHAARPIDAEQDFAASVERAHARQAERATERALQRERGIGREL
jgi:ATP-dependent exoDNAse (exonuclease V) alpha subunit